MTMLSQDFSNPLRIHGVGADCRSGVSRWFAITNRGIVYLSRERHDAIACALAARM